MAGTVRQLCKPHESAFAYVMADQVETLDQVINGDATNAEEFFTKNYVTADLRILLQQGLARLAGKSKQAMFELRQAMGGGKTHSMIALGLLARSSTLRAKYVSDIHAANRMSDARVVVVDGRSIDRTRHIWGEIITQLGQVETGSKHWRDGPAPPSKREWKELIGAAPILFLLMSFRPISIRPLLSGPARQISAGWRNMP
jgi:hypothetical protein